MQPSIWKFLKDYGIYILLVIVVVLYQTATHTDGTNNDPSEYSRSNYEGINAPKEATANADADIVNERKY
jgi:hypothetical protein